MADRNSSHQNHVEYSPETEMQVRMNPKQENNTNAKQHGDAGRKGGQSRKQHVDTKSKKAETREEHVKEAVRNQKS